MTKTKKVAPVSKYQGITFKVEETVLTTQPVSVPTNLAEEKEKFFKYGKTPKFEVQDPFQLVALGEKTKNKIRFDLQGEALSILEHVRNEYGDGNYYLEHAFGTRITKEEATPILLEYISENSLSESLTIHWCDNLACSAKMVWKGPMVNCNRPELRKYSLWINGSDENNYLRESGIRCLMDHEIGTHFFRMLNDGFQPWFADRAKFGLRRMGAIEGQCTEEGLAAINTALRGRVKFLWSPALAYYTACKSAEMTFKQLFDHIGRYTSNPDLRWKQVMRVKRGLTDPNDLGGFGNDQCYFEGAVTILRNMDNIDFNLLMSGKICYDELDRIKRVVRKDLMRYPKFMHNMTAYRKALKKMATINGLDKVHPISNPPAAYLKRLDERKAGLEFNGKKQRKVRCKGNPNKLRQKQTKANAKDGKGTVREDSSEIKSFQVSQPFVNMHRQRQEEAKRQKVSEQVYQSLEDLSSNITSLDTGIDKQIKDLQEIVKGHSWSSEDQEYKEKLLSQASSELSNDSLLMNESLRTGSAMDDAVTVKPQCEEIRPKTSFMDYKSEKIPPETPPLIHKNTSKNNSRPLKLSPLSTNNSNSNNSQTKKLGKKQKLLAKDQKEKVSNAQPKAVRKKKEEPLTPQMIENKMNNLKSEVQSQIRPDEIVVDLSEANQGRPNEPLDRNISLTPQNDSPENTILQVADSDTPQVNDEVDAGSLEVNNLSLNEKESVFSQITIETHKLESNKCDSNSVVKTGKTKLLERRASLSSNTIIEPGFYFDGPFNYGSDSSQSTPTPRKTKKKNPWAGIVSEYAQNKPVKIEKPKLDREYLKADLCQPFFIQAEQILQAEKLMRKSRPHYSKSNRSSHHY